MGDGWGDDKDNEKFIIFILVVIVFGSWITNNLPDFLGVLVRIDYVHDYLVSHGIDVDYFISNGWITDFDNNVVDNGLEGEGDDDIIDEWVDENDERSKEKDLKNEKNNIK